MTPDQLERRKHAIERVWDAEDHDPTLAMPQTLAVTGEAVKELQDLVATLDVEDFVERGRTLRYLGDCYALLAKKRDAEPLERGREAYTGAQECLERAGDIAEVAKLNFNFANTLRFLSDGSDRGLLEEARRRYFLARRVFLTAAPEYVPAVEQALPTLELQLRALDFHEKVSTASSQIASLMQRLERYGPDAKPAQLFEVENALRKIKGGEDRVRQLGEVRSFVDIATEFVRAVVPEDASRLAEWEHARKSFSSIAQQAAINGAQAVVDDEAIFEHVRRALENAAKNQEISFERRTALEQIFTQFIGLTRQQPESLPDQLASFCRETAKNSTVRI